MGLFDFKKKKNEVNQEKVDWYFSPEGKKRFDECIINKDLMMKAFEGDRPSTMIEGFCLPEGKPGRIDNVPCTFFADYLRERKIFTTGPIAYFACDLAIPYKKHIEYPDCLKEEYNAIISYAISITPYYKRDKELTYNRAVTAIATYIHHGFYIDYDALKEGWMLEENLYFNEKGKLRDEFEVLELMWNKAENRELLKGLDYFGDNGEVVRI